MKWLITGGCGFIGRSLISKLLSVGENQIRVLDNLSVGTRSDLQLTAAFQEVKGDGSSWSSKLELVEGDILDPEVIKKSVCGADVVVHLAANTGVGPSVTNPMADCRTNVIGTLNVLEGCREANIKRFVFASSGAPLGVQVPPLSEDMAPRPASPYGASKLSGEGYCSAYYHCFGVETVSLRFGNVYGEGSGHKQSVVAKFIKEALHGETLELYGDGTQTRDFIHISDLVVAIECAASVPRIGGETFQIATSEETTVYEMTEVLITALEAEGIPRPETRLVDKRDGDVMRNYSDTSKAKMRLNWEASIPLDVGLRRTVKYFVNKENKS
ncbi:NAD-dependent epimerase/dehydratase family protein [Planktomarina temperata]|nr:NAD-dependent epimerase/dehydratase family protein [Planktomarina temperata]